MRRDSDNDFQRAFEYYFKSVLTTLRILKMQFEKAAFFDVRSTRG